MVATFSEGLLYFFLYSGMGWICECIFCSVMQKQTVNRGMLKGPYCPIYGFGALFILQFTTQIKQSPVAVFLAAMLTAAVLEYFSSWLLEKIFKMRWWDYSANRFNLNGRICLSLALAFGAMGWILTYGIHPIVRELVLKIPNTMGMVVSNILITVFLLDLVSTVASIMGVSQRLQSLQTAITELKEYNEQYAWLDARDWQGSFQRLYNICEQEESPLAGDVRKRLDDIKSMSGQLEGFLKRYPSLDSGKWKEAVHISRQQTLHKLYPYRAAFQNALSRAGAGVKATGKAAGRSFANHFNCYRLFWVFFIAGVGGYIVETFYCFVMTGAIESRQGLLYGPFNQVYGFGAVLMVLLLAPLCKKNDRWLFLGSAVIGGAFEALCSYIQENVFGCVSWDHSGETFSIAGGRTSLLVMFFWGILGLCFMKGIYPRFSGLIERIPKRQGVLLAAVLAVILCGDMFLSGTAVHRWSERVENAPPPNAYYEVLDRTYPDEYMREVYPNLTMLAEEKR